jgi:hypothetical protein
MNLGQRDKPPAVALFFIMAMIAPSNNSITRDQKTAAAVKNTWTICDKYFRAGTEAFMDCLDRGGAMYVDGVKKGKW